MGLSISNITKRFGHLTALDNVSLEVPSGSFVCFLGPSGCGKTTLLRVIAGLDEADAGRILVDGRDLSTTTARERNFGIVFQSYSLFPTLSAARNVAYGLECRKWDRASIDERVSDMLKLVRLSTHADKLPHQMSGGQQQRIALARALAPHPSLLLLDEPLSALDAKVREELRVEIKSVQNRLGVTTIMVTHDQEEALAMADIIVVMRDGRIEQIGSPAELYETPKTVFVAEFVGRMNFLPSGASGGRICVRPEHVEMAAPGLSGKDIVPGRVTSVAYLGNLTRITMQPAAGGDTLVAELHGRPAVPTVGADIAMRVPAEACRVLA